MSTNANIQGLGLAHEYIKYLEAEYKKADNTLKINNAYYNSVSTATDEITIWRDKLRRYWANIKATSELASKVEKELKKLDEQTNCTCAIAQGYFNAATILLCKVKEVTSLLEFMSDQIIELRKRIHCVLSKDPVLDYSKSVLKCLVEFQAKLDAALQTALKALGQAILLIRCARLVLEDKKAVQSYTTWLWNIGQITDPTPGEGDPPIEADNLCWKGDEEQGKNNCPPVLLPTLCIDDDVPKPALDIKNSDYYISIDKALNGDDPCNQNDRSGAEKQWEDMQDKKDAAQKLLNDTVAKKAATSKALEEAKKAKKCN